MSAVGLPTSAGQGEAESFSASDVPEELGFHPLAEVFPLAEGAEFEALKEDIVRNGLRESVVTFEGRILDGRNRYRACRETGSPCRLRVYAGPDPAAYVVSLNLRRRHLNEAQRAMVAAKLTNLAHGQRADRERQICRSHLWTKPRPRGC